MAMNPQLTAVLSTATVLLLVATHNATAARLRGHDLCSGTDYPAICKATLKGENNPNVAIGIAIKELMAKTRQVKTAAKKGIRRKRDAMDTCYSNLDSAIDNLEKALGYIKEGDSFSVNIELSATVADYGACKDAVAGAPPNNLVTKSAGVLSQMVSNCLALSEKMKQ